MYTVLQTCFSLSPPANGDLIGNHTENHSLAMKVVGYTRCHAGCRIKFAREIKRFFKRLHQNSWNFVDYCQR